MPEIFRSVVRGPMNKVWCVLATGVVLATFTAICVPANAAVCGNEALRGQLGSSLLPDCRAYEMVSPAYQEGYPLLLQSYATEGNQAIVGGLGNLAGTPGAGEAAFVAPPRLASRAY